VGGVGWFLGLTVGGGGGFSEGGGAVLGGFITTPRVKTGFFRWGGPLPLTSPRTIKPKPVSKRLTRGKKAAHLLLGERKLCAASVEVTSREERSTVSFQQIGQKRWDRERQKAVRNKG